MKKLFSYSSLIAVAALATFHGTIHGTTAGVFLSEVQIAGNKSDDEFIELYNSFDGSFDLTGYQLRRKTESGSESSIKVFEKKSIIPAHGFFLWANSGGIFKKPLADAETSSSALADNNSIALYTKSGVAGVLVDSLTWGKGALFQSGVSVFPNPAKNTSLVRDVNTLAWLLSNSSTPTNSIGLTYIPPPPAPPPPIPTPPPISKPSTVRVNEVFPNPSAKNDQGEFIELYNFGSLPQDISDWLIHDNSAGGQYIFPAGTLIVPDSYLVITDTTFTFSLNNSDETLSLFDSHHVLIDTMSYATTKEDVSLNYTASGFRGGRPTPSSANKLNNSPEITKEVPDEGYRGVPALFNAKGKDADGDSLKYTWDFGDGHKSYKDDATHTYEDSGTYQVTLTTTDGSDDTVEHFTIEISRFPEPTVRVTALMPNPNGRDTDREWLLLENREKKSINLKGFSIATGWKKLSNHPIRDDFFIPSKATAYLTHINASFTLPNKKGKIELRLPGGKVIQKIKYKLEQEIADDIIYRKEKGQDWQWQTELKQAVTRNTALTIAPRTVKALRPPESVSPVAPDPPKEKTVTSRYFSLLNYGTQVKLNRNIQLSFPEHENFQRITPPEHYAVTFIKKILEEVNASLNAWQSANKEE